jgi:hypothetical protein
MIEACILQTIGHYSGYSDGGFDAFPPFFQAHARVQILLDHDRFLPDISRINDTFYHSMM